MKLTIDFTIPVQHLEKKWPSFFLVGSCFAENQAKRMKSLGMNIQHNPFGIIYNPPSIETILRRIVYLNQYVEEDFHREDEIFSWEHHGSFQYSSKQEASDASNSILRETHHFLKTTDVVVVTLGTSLVFTHEEKVVANCHKQPNYQFDKKQLTIDEVKQSLNSIIKLIEEINPSARILFTVSPIRHLRSGVKESSRSKAALIAGLSEVLDEIKDSRTSYFPSYEIFIDELRDYRFAKDDLTHPTVAAENYIWDRFCETYFNEQTRSVIQEVGKLNALASHRPKNIEKHQKLIKDQEEKLKAKYSFLRI